MRSYAHNKQQGAALIVALLMLLILAIIGISGMNDSIFDLRMTGNIQSFNDSQQQSDSGLTAVLSQRNTLFTGTDQNDVFDAGGSNALKDYITSTVNVDYQYVETTAARSSKPNSGNTIVNEHYLVDSDHSYSATGANTHTYMGVRRETRPTN